MKWLVLPALLLVLLLIRKPLGKLLGFCVKTLGALGALFILGQAGVLALGANLPNALVLACLGLPGVGLLLCLPPLLG